jgi:hypothetical protein
MESAGKALVLWSLGAVLGPVFGPVVVRRAPLLTLIRRQADPSDCIGRLRCSGQRLEVAHLRAPLDLGCFSPHPRLLPTGNSWIHHPPPSRRAPPQAHRQRNAQDSDRAGRFRR